MRKCVRRLQNKAQAVQRRSGEVSIHECKPQLCHSLAAQSGANYGSSASLGTHAYERGATYLLQQEVVKMLLRLEHWEAPHTRSNKRTRKLLKGQKYSKRASSCREPRQIVGRRKKIQCTAHLRASRSDLLIGREIRRMKQSSGKKTNGWLSLKYHEAWWVRQGSTGPGQRSLPKQWLHSENFVSVSCKTCRYQNWYWTCYFYY